MAGINSSVYRSTLKRSPRLITVVSTRTATEDSLAVEQSMQSALPVCRARLHLEWCPVGSYGGGLARPVNKYIPFENVSESMQTTSIYSNIFKV